MIRKVAMIVRKKTNFGFAIHATYHEAIELDRINGNKYWQDDTKKE